MKFSKEKRAQISIEMIVLLAAIVAVVIFFVGKLKTNAEDVSGKLDSQVEDVFSKIDAVNE